jgi:hypothetical protein
MSAAGAAGSGPLPPAVPATTAAQPSRACRYAASRTRPGARRAAHEIDHLNGRLYTSRMRDGVRPIPVSEYRGTRHTWTYPAAGHSLTGTPTA